MKQQLGLERSSKRNSMYNFTPNISRIRLEQNCIDLRNEAQLESMCGFSELMLQFFYLSENEAFFSFMDGLIPWAKKEL